MQARNTYQQWGWVAQCFHWLIFLLMVAAWIAVAAHENFPKDSPERAFYMMLHKACGLSVFCLVWLRLVWRLSGQTPTPEPAPRWQLQAATAMHGVLYVLMVLMPLLGLLASQFAGRPVSFFGLFEVPIFLTANKDLAGQLIWLHKEVLWPCLLVLLAGHIGAALWHHFVSKDRTLRRMLPFFSR